MISQQITQNADGSGKLEITCADQLSFPELVSLANELSIRPGIVTNGTITVLPPAPEPGVEG